MYFVIRWRRFHHVDRLYSHELSHLNLTHFIIVRYSAIGCYKDVSGARAMPVKLGHFPGGMTREARKKVVEKCAAAVKRRG